LNIGTAEPAHTISAFPRAEGGFAHQVTGLAVSPNGRFLIAVNEQGDVRLWDAASGL
jgi:hypothetical protein